MFLKKKRGEVFFWEKKKEFLQGIWDNVIILAFFLSQKNWLFHMLWYSHFCMKGQNFANLTHEIHLLKLSITLKYKMFHMLWYSLFFIFCWWKVKFFVKSSYEMHLLKSFATLKCKIEINLSQKKKKKKKKVNPSKVVYHPWPDLQKKLPKKTHTYTYTTRGSVTHYGLAIYIKKYRNTKEELWKFKYFTMQKYNLPKKSSNRRNQNPSRYYYYKLYNN